MRVQTLMSVQIVALLQLVACHSTSAPAVQGGCGNTEGFYDCYCNDGYLLKLDPNTNTTSCGSFLIYVIFTSTINLFNVFDILTSSVR